MVLWWWSVCRFVGGIGYCNILYNSYFVALAVGFLAVCGAVIGLVLSSMVYFDFFMALLSAIEDLAVYGAVFPQGP